MILPYFHETLSIYMGGIDNMVRHHDYIIAVLESVRPYPVARFWLHCHHLFVEGRKMSKSLGNILYTNDVLAKGFSARELRFFLIYNHYRGKVNFTWDGMAEAAGLLRQTRSLVRRAAADFRTGKAPRPAGKGAAQWAGELQCRLQGRHGQRPQCEASLRRDEGRPGQSGPGPPGFRRVHGPGKRLAGDRLRPRSAVLKGIGLPGKLPAALFSSRQISYRAQLRLDSEHFYLLDSLTHFTIEKAA